MSQLTVKIKELQTLCEYYHLTLVVKFYGASTDFIGINDDEQEVFDVCVWYRNSEERAFYIVIDSNNEKWTGGHFRKEDILLLLSIGDLSDEELNISPLQEKLKEK